MAEKKKPETSEAQWECTSCGYIYDPGVGDPAQEIYPGTQFDNLPDYWVCTKCGATKDAFNKKGKVCV